MSEKSKIKRAKKQAQQEEQGKKVVAWICGVLIVIALLYAIWTIMYL